MNLCVNHRLNRESHAKNVWNSILCCFFFLPGICNVGVSPMCGVCSRLCADIYILHITKCQQGMFKWHCTHTHTHTHTHTPCSESKFRCGVWYFSAFSSHLACIPLDVVAGGMLGCV